MKMEKINLSGKDKIKVTVSLIIIFVDLLITIAFMLAAILVMNDSNFGIFGKLFFGVSAIVLLTACPSAVVASKTVKAASLPLQTTLPFASPMDERIKNGTVDVAKTSEENTITAENTEKEDR